MGINIVGNFAFDPKISLAQEINYINMNPSAWSPTTEDFVEVASVRGDDPIVCSSFLEMLGVIALKQEKSVYRVNLFTHGDKHTIAFEGKVSPKPQAISKRVEVTLRFGPNLKALDRQSLRTLKSGGSIIVAGTARKLKYIQDRFVKNGALFLYCCNSGANPQLVQEIADTLRVTVVGFLPPIAYCPNTKLNPLSVERNRLAVGLCKRGVSTSFYHLVPDASGKTIRRHPRP